MFKLLLFSSTINCFLFTKVFGLIELQLNPSLSLVESTAINLIKSCYSVNKTIVVNYNVNKYLYDSLWSSEAKSLFLYHNSSEKTIPINNQKRMDIFVVSIKSPDHLSQRLSTLKRSVWWNIIATFLILDKANEDCENAEKILSAAWKFNLLKSLFVCSKSNQSVFIYTYNPYSDRAPKPWKRILQRNHWTMFNRKFKENICETLKFDRLKSLKGYQINVAACIDDSGGDKYNWVPGISYNESFVDLMDAHDAQVISSMRIAFHTSFVVNYGTTSFARTEPYGFDKRLLNESSDVALCLRVPFAIDKKLDRSYPIAYSSVTIVTEHPGYMSPFERIIDYYGFKLIIITVSILIITFFAIRISEAQRGWIFAALEIIRILINTSILSSMKTQSFRIFFTVILWYFIIIQSTFSGNLSAFLTKTKPRKKMETLKDLERSDITDIFIPKWLAAHADNPSIGKKLKEIDFPDCTSLVKKNLSAACITDIFYATKPAISNHLHMSEKYLGTNQYVYVLRKDWPLKRPFNMFLMNVHEAGFAKIWQTAIDSKEYSFLNRVRALSVIHFKEVPLKSLNFAFYILITGLILSIICFIIELIIFKQKFKRKRRDKLFHYIN